MSATMQCKKWWKRLNTGLCDISRTNAMSAWMKVKESRTNGTFIDNMIHQYAKNRLDEGDSLK